MCDKPVSRALARHDFGEGFCYPCLLIDAVSNLFREDAEYYIIILFVFDSLSIYFRKILRHHLTQCRQHQM